MEQIQSELEEVAHFDFLIGRGFVNTFLNLVLHSS
jgi:hypothetical protein